MAKSASDRRQEDWMNRQWRPMMAWMYFVVCIADFIIFPILWSFVQGYYHGNITEAWMPMTLQGAGLFHLAMGAILGIAAYGRTKEKTHDFSLDYNRQQNGFDISQNRHDYGNINNSNRNRNIPPQNNDPI
jgi:hypothetical protein